MKGIECDTNFIPKERTPKPRGRFRRRVFTPTVSSIGAAVGIFGGIAALFIGLVCCIIHEMVRADHVYNQAATTLLVMAIPMIMLGSILLDEIERK